MLRLIQAYREGFRVFVRRYTRPLSIEEAEEKRLFWAKVYVLCGLAALGTVTYQIVKSSADLPFRKDLPKNVAVGLQLLPDQPVRFLTFRGFQKVQDFTLSQEEMKKLAESKPPLSGASEYNDYAAKS